MTRVPVSKLRADLSTVINRVAFGKEPIIIQRSGKDVAVVLPMEALPLVEAIEDHYLAKQVEEAEWEGGDRISWEEAKRELGL